VSLGLEKQKGVLNTGMRIFSSINAGSSNCGDFKILHNLRFQIKIIEITWLSKIVMISKSLRFFAMAKIFKIMKIFELEKNLKDWEIMTI
jgi:hypothetical protein